MYQGENLCVYNMFHWDASFLLDLGADCFTLLKLDDEILTKIQR